MGDILVADVPHWCKKPQKGSRPVGSIWQCDDCGVYWIYRYTETSWGPVWDQVGWWQWRIRRRITQAQRPVISTDFQEPANG